MENKPVPCPVCGLPVVRPKNPGRGRPRKYCSDLCSAFAMIGQSRASHAKKQATKRR